MFIRRQGTGASPAPFQPHGRMISTPGKAARVDSKINFLSYTMAYPSHEQRVQFTVNGDCARLQTTSFDITPAAERRSYRGFAQDFFRRLWFRRSVAGIYGRPEQARALRPSGKNIPEPS